MKYLIQTLQLLLGEAGVYVVDGVVGHSNGLQAYQQDPLIASVGHRITVEQHAEKLDTQALLLSPCSSISPCFNDFAPLGPCNFFDSWAVHHSNFGPSPSLPSARSLDIRYRSSPLVP